MLNLSTFYNQMLKIILQKLQLLLAFFLISFTTGCETTSSPDKTMNDIVKNTNKIIKLEPEFELITTYRDIDKLNMDFGDFSLKRTNDGMTFYRLDRGYCRVFIQSKESGNKVENIMVFHLDKKKFFPKFNLKQCVS